MAQTTKPPANSARMRSSVKRRRVILWSIVAILALALAASAYVLVGIIGYQLQHDEVLAKIEHDPSPLDPSMFVHLEEEEVEAEIPFLPAKLEKAQAERRVELTQTEARNLEEFLKSKVGPQAEWRYFEYLDNYYRIYEIVK